MKSGFSSINELWGYLAIEELIRNGVDCYALSPGSRSTPLTYAVSQQKQVMTVVHFDERGAAFYALGHARATGKPAAVICTSGTAGANFMPAIVESSVDHVPLVILTADRPAELRHTGTNQTIDQVKMFGDYVRWFFDVPCPDQNIQPEFILTTIDQAVHRAMISPRGPVHLNFMFREPLSPASNKQNFNKYLNSVDGWSKRSKPLTSYSLSNQSLSDETIKSVASIIAKGKSGLIIAGKMNQKDSAALLKLSDKLGWPIFPDIASNLRLDVKGENIVSYYDQLLVSNNLNFRPKTLLHLGSQSVSKRLLQFLDQVRPNDYIRITDHPERLDPNHQVTLRLQSDITDFCKRLTSSSSSQSTATSDKLTKLSNKIGKVLKETIELAESHNLTEPAVAILISRHISKSSALFLASSMPVREMDMFATPDGSSVRVEYNRGASGIDGTIATAVGYASGLKKPVTLFMGDLAFLHDLNSLELVRKSAYPLIIVILNNDGGGIFSFLPVAEIGQGFEEFFGTPHGLSFQKSAEQFDLQYFNPKTVGEFTKDYAHSQKQKCSTIIEVTTERISNRQLHQKISQAIKNTLDKA